MKDDNKVAVDAYKYKIKNKRIVVGKYIESDRFVIEFTRLAKDVKDSKLAWEVEGKIATFGFGLSREAAERVADGLNKLLQK